MRLTRWSGIRSTCRQIDLGPTPAMMSHRNDLHVLIICLKSRKSLAVKVPLEHILTQLTRSASSGGITLTVEPAMVTWVESAQRSFHFGNSKAYMREPGQLWVSICTENRENRFVNFVSSGDEKSTWN